MSLKLDIRCPRCGGIMELAPSGKSAVCPDCNTSLDEETLDYIDESRRQSYKIQSAEEFAGFINKAESAYVSGDYTGAREFFVRAINANPGNYLGWRGLFHTKLTDNYMCVDNGYKQDFGKAMEFAPEEQKKALQDEYDKMLAEFSERKKRLEDSALTKENVLLKRSVKASAGEKRGYKTEYIFICAIAVLFIAAVAVAFTVGEYLTIAVILMLCTAVALYGIIKNVTESKKITALVESGECKTVTQLMVKLKKRKKEEFLKTLGGIIKSGRLIGYEILNGEDIRKV